MTDPILQEAFEVEAKDIDVKSLMQEMLNAFQEEKDYQPTPMDELKVRKLMLARKYLMKDIEHLTILRDAVVQEWNDRIKRKQEEIDDINGLIAHYLKEVNKGKKLSLDVGTATLRRVPPKAKVVDKERAKQYLQEIGELEKFLKAPELDTTLLQKTLVNQFKEYVENKAQEIIEKEKAVNDGKITKKREKEILLEVERELADEYFKNLPDFVEYVPEKETLSITMK